MNSLTSKRSSILVFPWLSCSITVAMCPNRKRSKLPHLPIFTPAAIDRLCTQDTKAKSSNFYQLLQQTDGPPTQTLFWTSSKTLWSSMYQILISVPSYPVLPYPASLLTILGALKSTISQCQQITTEGLGSFQKSAASFVIRSVLVSLLFILQSHNIGFDSFAVFIASAVAARSNGAMKQK